MGSRGPIRKPGSFRDLQDQRKRERVRDEAQAVAWYPLPDDLLKGDETWHPSVQRFWQSLAGHPLADQFTALTWVECEATAILLQQYLTKRSFNAAGELRQRMARIGSTPDELKRMGVDIASLNKGEGEPAEVPAVHSEGRVNIDAYRARRQGA